MNFETKAESSEELVRCATCGSFLPESQFPKSRTEDVCNECSLGNLKLPKMRYKGPASKTSKLVEVSVELIQPRAHGRRM